MKEYYTYYKCHYKNFFGSYSTTNITASSYDEATIVFQRENSDSKLVMIERPVSLGIYREGEVEGEINV